MADRERAIGRKDTVRRGEKSLERTSGVEDRKLGVGVVAAFFRRDGFQPWYGNKVLVSTLYCFQFVLDRVMSVCS
jgi:hypothetical protein